MNKRRLIALALGLAAICGAAPSAFGAPKWLRCPLTEYSGNGGDAPFSPIAPNVRIVVFDDSPAGFFEYLNGQLQPGNRIEIDSGRIVGHVGIDHFHINRLTGQVMVYRGVGGQLAGIYRGSCQPTTPMTVRAPKF